MGRCKRMTCVNCNQSDLICRVYTSSSPYTALVASKYNQLTIFVSVFVCNHVLNCSSIFIPYCIITVHSSMPIHLLVFQFIPALDPSNGVLLSKSSTLTTIKNYCFSVTHSKLFYIVTRLLCFCINTMLFSNTRQNNWFTISYKCG